MQTNGPDFSHLKHFLELRRHTGQTTRHIPIGVGMPDADAETLVAGSHEHAHSIHILHHHRKNRGKAPVYRVLGSFLKIPTTTTAWHYQLFKFSIPRLQSLPQVYNED
ncbi:uncharacterized protein LOC144288332 [Canis aureus]